MKDILKHYSKYILLDTLVVATLFAGAHAILSLFHLKFIEWVYYAVIGIIIIGILLGIFQLLLKIRKNYVKYVAICVGAICLIPLTYICILIFAFTYKPMHIVEKDGIKCVAYVRSFLQVYVDYYEYKNPLIIGNEVLFTDYFGKGGFDPFVDGYEDDSMMEENAAMDDTTEITDDSEDERIDDENIFSQQDNESDTAIDADNDGYPLTEEFQPYKKELTAVATYIKDNGLYHDVKAGNEFSEFLVYNISAKGHPYVNIAEQVYEQDGISIIATHYIIINESYVENGSREYVYQIKFEDESGNEVASRKVVDFYLIDTETLVITDEKTNDWH